MRGILQPSPFKDESQPTTSTAVRSQHFLREGWEIQSLCQVSCLLNEAGFCDKGKGQVDMGWA